MDTDSKNDSEASTLVALSLLSFTNTDKLKALERVREEGSFAGLELLLSGRQREIGRRIYDACCEGGIEVITIVNPRYPNALKQTDGAPLVLFIRSERPEAIIPDTVLGVVGTRAASVGVCQYASGLAAELAFAGFTVVSGLALGIDGAAHRGALQAAIDCPTVAVLAHGLDMIYPSSHQALARQILAAGGVLVSEYPPSTEPLKHHFLARNRIIAGLSRGVIIVQAGARSGSLVTAQFAADFGRDVFIVSPDSSDDRFAGGGLMLEQGALVISSAADVLAEYGVGRPTSMSLETSEDISLTDAMCQFGLSYTELVEKELRGELVRLQGNRVRFTQGITRSSERWCK